MSSSTQKELNLLITTPQVPEFSPSDDSLKYKVTVQEPSIQDNDVCDIKPQPQLKDTDSSKSKIEPEVQIKWIPQVSSFLLWSFFLPQSVVLCIRPTSFNPEEFTNTHGHWYWVSYLRTLF